MAYLKIKNQLINTNKIYYVDTNPASIISIYTKKSKIQLSAEEWDEIKDGITTASNFKEIPNYGYLNLDLISKVIKTDDNYYSIKFDDPTKDLILNPTNTKDIDETVFDEIKSYVPATGGGSGGVSAYSQLSGKPKINNVELSGNKTSADLLLASATDLEAKQNKLTAGTGIEIKDDTINCTATGTIDGATLDGVDVAVTDKKLTITLPKAGATAGIAKAGEGLKAGTDGAIDIDDTKVVMADKIDTADFTEDDTKVPSSKLAKTKLDKEVTDRTAADTKLEDEKLNKIIPSLENGKAYKQNQIVFQDSKLVRVVKDIASYDATTNKNDVSIILDDTNSLTLVHNFTVGSTIRANTYVFKDGSFYKSKVDITSAQDTDLQETTKFEVIYKHAEVEIPIASASVKGGVKIGDGIKVDAQDGTISLDTSKLSVVEYKDANQSIKKNQIVIYANDLYICKEDIDSTAGWTTDESKMEPVDTNSSEVDVIDYDKINQNDEVKKGKIVVYNNKIYLAKETFNKSAQFTDDQDKLIETALQIDLAQYFTKKETTAELEKKAAISVPTLTASQSYKQGQLVQKDGYVVKVKEEITSYDETNDKEKVEPIVNLTEYCKTTEVEDKDSKKADLVLPTVENGKKYVANQLAILSDSGNSYVVRVKEELTTYTEATDKEKLEKIGYLPVATSDVLGGIKLGDGLKYEDEKVNVDRAIQAATTNAKYIQNQLVIDEDGNLCKVTDEIASYTKDSDASKLTKIGHLEVATADKLGGIKLGNGIEADTDNNGKVNVKVKANGYLKVDTYGVNLDDSKVDKSTDSSAAISDDDNKLVSSKLIKSELLKKLDLEIPTLTAGQSYEVGKYGKDSDSKVYYVKIKIDNYTDTDTDKANLTEVATFEDAKDIADAVFKLAIAFEEFKNQFATTTDGKIVFDSTAYDGETSKDENKVYIVKNS